MRDLSNVDEKTAQHVTNLLKTPNPDIAAAEKAEAAEIVKYYEDNFEFVQLVVCESCGADLCMWVLDRNQVQSNLVNHHQGLRRIVIGDKLLASRKRLDGAMGYSCICGNDSRLSSIEKGLIEETPWNGGGIPSMEPHIEAKIRQRIVATNFKPDVKDLGNGHSSTDGFTHKKIK
jgi:hypothetical protein